MRFFKYLIFLFFIPSLASAAIGYRISNTQLYNGIHESKDALCAAVLPKVKLVYPSVTQYRIEGDYCKFLNSAGSQYTQHQIIQTTYTPKCFYPDYKIVSQPITSLKKVMCLPVNGAVCKYVGDPTGLPVINGAITTTFSSVSQTSDPDCKEELVNPPCDPKNPYGGCFTPADDGCTRQFNGSIECPAQTFPSVEKGCNGATYCDRPPQGCGDGYVSGSFNGKLLCVKTSPSDGSGNEGGADGEDDGTGTGSNSTDGTGTSTSTGTETSTTTNSDGSSTTTNTTTNNTTVNNFKIDFSPVVNAVKQVSADIKNLKNELLTSISELTKKLDTTNTKIDETNSKLDTSNTNLTSIKDSSLRQEELLKSIRDKSGAGSASGAQTDIDLTETNSLLTSLNEKVASISDSLSNIFSDEGKSEIEQLGQESNDSRYIAAQSNAQISLNSLANKLTFSNSACVSDFQIQIPIFGSINIALSQWCGLLALLKILIHLAVLLTCLRMVDASVRTI